MTDSKKPKKKDEVHEMARQKFLDIESRSRLHHTATPDDAKAFPRIRLTQPLVHARWDCMSN